MEKIFCTNCGSGNLLLNENLFECQNCGSKFERERVDSKLFLEIIQADNERQACQFEKARDIYKRIIENYPDEDLTDVYWGLFLCEQNVIFEEDGKGEKFPSFYKISSESVEDTPSFNKAIAYASKHNREKVEIFSSLGDKIESARKMYLDISTKTKPFDVFICFKNTDFNGNHTPDRQLALDIYNEFSGKYNIFFSEKTLKNIKSSYRDYEPNIYYGLYTSSVMLLICSKKEYIESQWLKNEWSRFTKINKQGGNGKCIIPIFTEGFNPNDLPSELWHNQGIFDDRKFMSNLESQLESIINPIDELEELRKAQKENELKQQLEFEKKQEELRKENERRIKEQEDRLRQEFRNLAGGVSTNDSTLNYIEAIKKFLEIGNFVQAENNIEELRKTNPNAFEVYYYSIFVNFRCKNVDELKRVKTLLSNENLQNAKLFAVKDSQKELLEELINAHNNYFNEIVEEIKDSLNKGDFLEFSKNLNVLKNFRNDCFETYYFDMFLVNNTTKIEKLATISGFLTSVEFKKAKMFAKKDEEKDLIKNLEDLYNSYDEDLIKNIETALENKDEFEFERHYQILNKFDSNCFESFYYGLFNNTKILDKYELSKKPDIKINSYYQKLLSIKKTKKQQELVNELNKLIDEHYLKLVSDIEMLVAGGNKVEFKNKLNQINEYKPTTFESIYYSMFDNHNASSWQDLARIPAIIISDEFTLAKSLAKTNKQLEEIKEIENEYTLVFDEKLKQIGERHFNECNNFESLKQTYDKVTKELGVDYKAKLSQIVSSIADKFYFDILKEYNKILDKYFDKLKKQHFKTKESFYEFYNKFYDETVECFNDTKFIETFEEVKISDENKKLEDLLLKKTDVLRYEIFKNLSNLTKVNTKKSINTKLHLFAGFIGFVLVSMMICFFCSKNFFTPENYEETNKVFELLTGIFVILAIYAPFIWFAFKKLVGGKRIHWILKGIILYFCVMIGAPILTVILIVLNLIGLMDILVPIAVIIPYALSYIVVSTINNTIFIVLLLFTVFMLVMAIRYKGRYKESIYYDLERHGEYFSDKKVIKRGKKVKFSKKFYKVLKILGYIALVVGIILIVYVIINRAYYTYEISLLKQTFESCIDFFTNVLNKG